MNTLEIQQALNFIPQHTTGVFPADKIPKVWPKPIAIVANTDGSKKPGQHWVAIYVGRDGRGWYFDSYGLPPIIPQHLSRLRENCKFFRCNTRQLQDANSTVCGQYCIVFLHFMSVFASPVRFLSLFCTNTIKNDSIVREYYQAFTNKYNIRPKSREFIGNGYKSIQDCCIRKH